MQLQNYGTSLVDCCKSVLFGYMNGLSLKELVTLFLRSEAKRVTFPNINLLLSIAIAT